MAVRTCERVTLPEEQAEPDETAMPSRSKFISRVSALMPGMAKQVVLGSRSAPCAKMTAPSSEASSWSRKSLTFNRFSLATAAKPAMATRFSVPALRRNSWPPPTDEGFEGQAITHHEGANRRRATDLVGGNGHHVDAEQAEIHRHFAEGLHRIGMHQRAMLLRQRHHFADAAE